MYDFLLTSAFLKRLFLDQVHIRRSKWNFLFKRTQLNPAIPLFRDREQELVDFFQISPTKLRSLYIRKGFPNTRLFKSYLDGFFRDRVDPGLLKIAYEEAAFFYCMRLMLAFERYSMISGYLDTLFVQHGKRKQSLENWRVLDYGCGVSDAGLLLALLGAQVTICDLADSKLSFAEWRYRRRELEVDVIAIANPQEIPPLRKDNYDLIIATEVLEHVPDPLQCLRTLTGVLHPGGFLFNSMGNGFDRDIGGDHLESAINIGKSEEYQRYYEANYVPLGQSEGLICLFRKADVRP
jgi:2-polyprenyl-3-methyl-5-hydroxy-6-metoxy-1,4-benzoquinol methylase